ncbi:unnamed protein product, partial [Haemonchus placei]|uniref:Fibronectin type-III domain-containing protein n=1 Tax=Haemonchus placei TaxID=6290 RepID=A0A0N4VWL9_HAEPC
STSPLIQSVKALVNSSVILEFLPAEDVDLVSNYTVEYRDVTETGWNHFDFESDASNRVLLTGLEPNRTYEARLFVNGHVIRGHRSRLVTFTTNNTAQLPKISLDPETEVVFDPDILVPLEVRCDVISSPPIKIFWLVNGQRIQPDHAFYTVTTSTHDGQNLSSSLRMKSRTRSDNLTCVAVNPAGQIARSVSVQIRGPGSPPSSVTLQSERGGYTVSWLPPSHPNGNITVTLLWIRNEY